MRPQIYHRNNIKRLNPEVIEKLEFLDCLNLIRELQQLGVRELRTQESIKIIKKLESRIKHLGRTESYKCMAALPAVNALVS
jgi:hypothetical protein